MKTDRTHLLDELQLFHGAFSPMRAELYARVGGLRPGDGYRLEGEVYGPLCESSRTLPARNLLSDAGEGASLLARAVVADPCPWSADVPAIYRVSVRLSRGNDLVEEKEQMFGFRAMGVAAGRLYRAGQPWVLRAVSTPEDPKRIAWDDWRAAGLAMAVQDPGEEICLAATRHGVPLVAFAGSRRSQLADEIRRLASFVAVAVVVLPSEPSEFDPRAIAPNLLFAQEVALGGGDLPAGWAQLQIVDASMLQTSGSGSMGPPRAVLIQRRQRGCVAPAQWRESLQQLERDTALGGAPAGYLIRAT